MKKVSFIVPANNESVHIADCYASIRAHVPASVTWEVIVVDNGSQDDTFAIASTLPSVRAVRSEGTVSAARNTGAALAEGAFFVFLDADVRLTPRWAAEFEKTLQRLEQGPELLTGSTVAIPDDSSLIERYWFGSDTRRRKYINSGHLVVSRALFERLGGFDPALRTGEDSDFSKRALLTGARIEDNARLHAIHLGFPQTLRGFAYRELWHGQGDTGSLSKVLKSSVALVSLLFAGVFVSGVTVAILSRSFMPLVIASVGCELIAAYCAIKRVRRFDIRVLAVSAALYNVYLLCRAAAVFIHPNRWHRS